MLEFKDKLKSLLENNSLSPEKLADKLPNNKKISASTIRNYLKGIPPKDIENYEILDDYFNVPVQYLYDKNVTSKEFANIEFGKELGLTDNAIQTLKRCNSAKKDFENSPFTMIDTINLLLEEDSSREGILMLIDSYLNLTTKKDEKFTYTYTRDGYSSIYQFGIEDLTNILLIELQTRLIELRKKIQSQNNN